MAGVRCDVRFQSNGGWQWKRAEKPDCLLNNGLQVQNDFFLFPPAAEGEDLTHQFPAAWRR